MEFSDNLIHDFDYIHVYDFILIVTKNPHGIIVGVSYSADRVVIPTNCFDAGVGPFCLFFEALVLT